MLGIYQNITQKTLILKSFKRFLKIQFQLEKFTFRENLLEKETRKQIKNGREFGFSRK